MNEQAKAVLSLYPALILIFPLLGFLLNGLAGKKIASEKISGIIGSGVIGISFLLSAFILSELLARPPEERSFTVTLFNWIAAGGLSVDAAYHIDQLSVLMMLIVTGVGFLIHVYSIGYMRGDPAFWRFFSYLNLFIFMMLNLVMADNFLLMFLGWEWVGLCSYLLIGFWHARKFDTGGYAPGAATTSDAAKKAFVVNRIGDAGFLIAMFMIFAATGTLNFETLFTQAPARFALNEPLIVGITLLLFLGATGKSAQIPLYIWLPDAMAGPTPVSALIHAATMVTAGVYMVARCSVLFVLAPATMETVAIVGIATAFFAATMGLVQTDIKKILAYSTISQLGYMFAGLGVGAFTAGLFHVTTHAFFKALLFLGAGAVIHALHDEQDVTKMGGLKKFMPGTYRTQFIAALAIAGVPPLSGFFSKDEILWKAFSGGSAVIWVVGWLTAGLTAFYMFRMMTLVFEGEPRFAHDRHPHEAPATMLVPLVILAFLSVAGGFLGIPQALGGGNILELWLEPVFERSLGILGSATHGSLSTEYLLMALSVAVGLAGIFLARTLYLSRRELVERMAGRFAATHGLLFHKYYVDETFDAVIVNPLKAGSRGLLWKGIDARIIDGAVNGCARLLNSLSTSARKAQTGNVSNYGLAVLIGISLLLGFIIARWNG
ncbi:MAG TPA: NADH-quinone oxidoreductase subunit L [Bacteroidota bacterium]|nr:NADH-quinone oxidoreductase subunit L [Bacteroidota bacterium]